MKYGFVIDHRKCIGCHACTVACKAEHNVPVGSFRTWVKYIEQGTYPDARRFFSVLRCNHCEDAPCVTICPVTALFKRDNGIVDFDGDRCIGCKSCMQACPYDALYINPDTNTAEKCNYCAHKVEVGLEPACVIVCPEQAIIAGDMDDPTSKIARLIASEETLVRKPEAGTRPKLHYIEVNPSALRPTEQTHTGGYLWAESRLDPVMRNEQALAEAEAKARTTYDVAHDRPWGWKVSAYLWTKSVAAGAFILAAVALGLGFVYEGPSVFRAMAWQYGLFEVAAPVVALIFLLATLVLLVADLRRPERFLSILVRPQWRSWLVLGGYVLAAYGGLLTVWLGVVAAGLTEAAKPLMWLGAVLAVLAAIYSAFLFRQARGRVFWHSPFTVLHLLIQALIGGAAMLLVVYVIGAWVGGVSPDGPGFDLLRFELLGALVAHGVLIAGELYMPEESAEKTRAARLIRQGIFSRPFWFGAVGAGIVVPLVLLATGLAGAGAAAGLASLLALGGLFIWEHLWVQAGQAVPLS